MIDFSAVEAQVDILKHHFEAGELTEKIFEQELLALIDQSSDGYYWMIGHHTGQWYRFDGKRWVIDQPNAALEPYIQQSTTAEAPMELDWNEVFFSMVLIIFFGIVIYLSAN